MMNRPFSMGNRASRWSPTDRRSSGRALSALVTTLGFLASQTAWLPPAHADKLLNGSVLCANPGADGPLPATTQVNTYFPGTSASVSAGATSLDLGNGVGSPAIKPGDLLLVVQMQGADIDSTNTGAYGDGTSTNNGSTGLPTYPADGTVNGALTTNLTAGNFEYVIANNTVPVTGGTLNLITPLVNSYNNANFGTQGQRRFQVIRVPQFSDANVTTNIAAVPWNGTIGGIVVMDVAGTLTLNGGSISADRAGFRGGGGRVLGGDGGTPTLFNTDVVTLSTRKTNASKAEGIAGTPKYLFDAVTKTLLIGTDEGYPNGSYSRGAPGNAGGGGTDGNPKNNDQNAGGGGGSNGGQGGKGGYTWSTSLPYGGDGGAPFAGTPRQLVLGGGGGAGTTNNATGSTLGVNGLDSSGAPGGGLVIVRATRIGGTGTISANGGTATGYPANDASGGGGGGGSLLVIADSGSLASTVTLQANGGNGGSNSGGGSPHGPGGGGGGGVIFSTPGASTLVAAGAPGTTTGGVYGGATGGTGLAGSVNSTPADVVTGIAGASCVLQVTKSTSTPGPLLAPGTAVYTIKATNPIGDRRPEARGVKITDAGLPNGFSHTAAVINPVYAGGATGPATVTSTGTASQPEWSGFTIPPGGSVTLTFSADITAGTVPSTYSNSAIVEAGYINTNAGVSTVPTNTVKGVYDGTLPANTGEDVTITSVPTALKVEKTAAVAVDNDGSGGTTPLASQVATPGDTVEYTLLVQNNSATTAASNVVLSDPIPANTTYVPGSLQIASGANAGNKSDTISDDQAELNGTQVVFRLGTGANATTGGSLGITAADNSTVVKFRVKINDPLPANVSQLTNQAQVTSTGNLPTLSNDPTTPPLGDPTITRIGPRLRLVKRITGINKYNSQTNTFTFQKINGYNDLATDVNDNASTWPGGSAATLLGAINGSQVPAGSAPAPKDQVEYTIYFLSDGAMSASGVSLCDFVPDKQTYVAGTIELRQNGTLSPIGDLPAASGASGFYPATTGTFPPACNGTNNSQGAVQLQLGPLAAANANTVSSYGFFRFRAKVN